MSIKIRPRDASVHEDEWLEVSAWLAALRHEERAEPPGEGHAEASRADRRPSAAAPGQAAADGRTGGPSRVRDRSRHTEPAVIGDQLRMPIVWCEMGSCISWHADRAALGEADNRARAIGAGWRVDAFGRLACPQCQQADPGFRVCYPVVVWNRNEAIRMAARAAAVLSGHA